MLCTDWVRAAMSKAEETARDRKKKHTLSFYMGLFFVAVVIYVIVNIIMMGGGMKTTIVQKGIEEDVIKTTGYIFRDSTIINAPVPGYIACEVDENSRVKEGEKVVSLYKNEINYNTASELRSIDEKIKRLSENSAGQNSIGNDPAKIEQDISEMLRTVHEYGYKKDGRSLSEMCDNVNGLITKKRIISGKETMSEDTELERLKARKTEIEEQNDVDRSLVYSPETGSFTAVVDGLEEKLSTSHIADITPSYLKGLDKQKCENLVTEKVNQGEPVGKIVNNFLWNVAIVVSEDTAKNMLVGDEVGIRFTSVGGETVQGRIAKISSAENGEVAVVISSNKYIDSVYSTSKTEVEIVRHTYEGFRIPSKSIRIIGQQKGVYVVRNDKARFIPVNTLFTGKDWVIISETIDGAETVRLYDELIVSGSDLYEGKDVR